MGFDSPRSLSSPATRSGLAEGADRHALRAAPGACVAPANAEKAEVKNRVLAWIDRQFPDEKQAPASDMDGMELVFNAVCKDGSAVFADVSQDRTPKKQDDTFPTRRNFVLRIDGNNIETIAARTSTASMGWMEWADEGRLAVVTQIDLDGDGAADLVWTDHQHEGGDISTWDSLSVRFTTGKTAPIVRVKNLADVRVVKSQLVIAGQDRTDTRAIYACVGKDLRVAPCAAAASLQRTADQLDLETKLDSLDEPRIATSPSNGSARSAGRARQRSSRRSPQPRRARRPSATSRASSCRSSSTTRSRRCSSNRTPKRSPTSISSPRSSATSRARRRRSPTRRARS